jgi:hypothetical protein
MVRPLPASSCAVALSRLRTVRRRVVAAGLAGVLLPAAALVLFERSPAVAAATCDRSADPSSFGSQVSAAGPGQTICLASGDYGTWQGTNKQITITAASGQTTTMRVSFGSGASGFTLEGLSGMAGTIFAGTSNVTIRNSTFVDQLDIEGAVRNIVIDHNDFTYPVQSVPNSANSKIFLDTSGSSPGSAVTIKNNDIENGDLDGVHFGGGSGDLIIGNTFKNLCDRNVNHTDNIQFEGGTQITIAGNYFYGPGPTSTSNCVAGGIVSYDGHTDGLLIEDNVVDVTRDWGIELYSDQNSVVWHNTVVWHPRSYSAFNSGDGHIDVDRKSQDPASTGTHVYDNIASVDFNNGSTGAEDHNVSGQSASYVGPLNTYDGFKLSSASPVGLKTATDGLDDGARISAAPGPTPAQPPPHQHSPTPVRHAASPARLVAWLRFGEASGSRVVDRSGFGNNGTIHGATRTELGKHGRALVFDGLDDYVSVRDSKSLNLRTGMTLEAWVRPAATGRAWRGVILKDRAGGPSYGLYANDNRRRASGWVRTRTGYGTDGGTGLRLRRWSYLAATYDGRVLRLYINGVLRSSRRVRGLIRTGRGPLMIGGNGVLGRWFKGTILDVRIWRTALSAAAIREEMRVDAPVPIAHPGRSRHR